MFSTCSQTCQQAIPQNWATVPWTAQRAGHGGYMETTYTDELQSGNCSINTNHLC